MKLPSDRRLARQHQQQHAGVDVQQGIGQTGAVTDPADETMVTRRDHRARW